MIKNKRTGFYRISSLKFWGKFIIEGIGIAAAGAALMLLLVGSNGMDDFLNGICSMYPYYLVVMGAFVIMMLGFSSFQSVLPILLAMSVTRKSAVRGVLLSIAALTAGLLLVTGGIWALLPTAPAAGGLLILPVLAGGLFAAASLGILFGAVKLRWGKIGMILTVLVSMLMGGCLGYFFAMGGDSISALQDCLMKYSFTGITLIGVFIYAVAGVFTAAITRRIEVKL